MLESISYLYVKGVLYYAIGLVPGLAAITMFTITDLAKKYQVTTRTLRFYEDQGLLTPDRSGRNRVYRKRDRVRLELILRSKRLGFSIFEIKELFDLYDSAQADTRQVAQFLKALASKRSRLAEMKKDLEAMLSEIDMFEYQYKRALGKQSSTAIKTILP